MVQWKISNCARLNKESQESCRGQPSPRRHLNSLENYWTHWNDTFASFLFIPVTKLGFYFQVWRRFLPIGDFTWHHWRAGGYWQASHAQSPTRHQCGVPRPHSIVQPSSFPKPQRATSDCAPGPFGSFTPLHLKKGCTFTKIIFTGHRFKCLWMQF